MKKTVLFLICVLIVPSMAFSAVTLGDGTSIKDSGATNPHPTEALSLSPNVSLSYDSDSDDTYALTGANQKGGICYAVMSGDQGVYQQEVTPGDTTGADGTNVIAADDGVDYSTSADWDGVGQ
jgi:hypothetical protein